jgi:phospholipase C
LHGPPLLLRLASLILLVALTRCGDSSGPSGSGIHKIEHVVVIMQENRSFDSYFGTFPGVDGIPMQNGVPTVCIPDPQLGGCIRPYHDSADKNIGGPPAADDFLNRNPDRSADRWPA